MAPTAVADNPAISVRSWRERTLSALLPLQLGRIWLALPAGHVQEILGSRTWVSIPGAPVHLPGVIAWRGRAVAVLDLAALVGAGETLAQGKVRERNVVIAMGGNTVAIPVDTVHEVRDVDEERIRPAHATSQKFSSTEVDINGFLMPIVDLSAMMSAVTQEPS
jgi:chemotaxis signal transduction protein